MEVELPEDLVPRLDELELETRRLAALPLAVPIVRGLRFREIVDAHMPAPRDGAVSHGLALEALLLFCLQHLGSVEELFELDDLGDWLEESGLPILYGVEAGELGKERVIEALDALHPVRWQVAMDLAREAVRRYVAEPEVAFHGFTNVSLGQRLEGFFLWDYEWLEAEGMSFGLASVGWEGLPLLGAAGEAQGLVEQAGRLQALLPGRSLVWLSSRASLTTHATMEGLVRLGQHFLLAARDTRQERARAAEVPRGSFRSYRAAAGEKAWRAAETEWTVPPRRGAGGQPLAPRAIVVQRDRGSRQVLLTDLRDWPVERLLALWRRKAVVEARNRGISTRLEAGGAWLETSQRREALAQVGLVTLLVARMLESRVEQGSQRLGRRRGRYRPSARGEPWLDRVGSGSVTARELARLFRYYEMVRFSAPGRVGPWQPVGLRADQSQMLEMLGLPEPAEAMALLGGEASGSSGSSG